MRLFAALRGNEYLSQVSVLLSGSLIAQVITLLAAPILTRLYSPDAFGALALLLAIVAAVAPGVGGRYEAAVVVAVKEEDRLAFFFIALWITTAICIAFYIALALAFNLISSWLNANGLGNWLWFAPLLLWCTGFIALMHSWANAVKRYTIIGRSLVLQNLIVCASAVGLGVVWTDISGLLLANLIGPVIVSMYLATVFNELVRSHAWPWNSQKSKLAWSNKDFPLYSGTSSILNGVMSALPVFFIAMYFSDSIVGYYALLVRVGAAPLSFISQSVSRVNFQKTSELVQAGISPARYIVKITLVLFVIAFVPAIPLILFAPSLFELLFGASWRPAGVLLAILTPALVVQFVVSTLSMSFVAVGHLRLAAAWQLLSLVVTLAVFGYMGPLGNIERFFWAFMMKDVALYLLYYAALIYAVRNRKRCVVGN